MDFFLIHASRSKTKLRLLPPFSTLEDSHLLQSFQSEHVWGLFTQYINSGCVCKTLSLVGNPLHA